MNEMRNGGASLEIWNVTWSGCVNVNDFCYNQEKLIFISLKSSRSRKSPHYLGAQS